MSAPRDVHAPRAGFAFALLAALSFGLTAPVVQRSGSGVGPFTTATLLYAGAALVAFATKRASSIEAPLRRSHATRLVAMALAGAVVAPAALAWGLQRTSGMSASLALSFEAVFTTILGVIVYREHVGRRVAGAVFLTTLGGVLLALGSAHEGRAQLVGLGAVVFATFAWALDNALSNGLAEVDPSRVVLAKSTLGVLSSAALAFGLRETPPTPGAATALLVCGASGYGASLRLYLLAQRRIGAGRTASLFGLAPFLAASVAAALGQPFGGPAMAGALVLMVAGLALHLTERHAHSHRHEPLEHEHAHRHDDGHHDHRHDPMPVGPHSHPHRHDVVTHSHAHLPDAHHAHRHETGESPGR